MARSQSLLNVLTLGMERLSTEDSQILLEMLINRNESDVLGQGKNDIMNNATQLRALTFAIFMLTRIHLNIF